MEVFSKISTLQQQQFVYMIDCVWSFLIACVFNLQIRQGRRLQFTSAGGAKRSCLYLSKWVKEGRRTTRRTTKKIPPKTKKGPHKNTQCDIPSLWFLYFSHGFGENLSANAKNIQISNGCADIMSDIIFVTYFHVFILCKIACMCVVVQTQGPTWRPNRLTDGKWWNRIFISFLKEILVYIFKMSSLGRRKMLTMLMVVRCLESSSKMNEDQCEYLRLFCSRLKRKMCEINKGSTICRLQGKLFHCPNQTDPEAFCEITHKAGRI